jgi:hypothetical protein
MIIVNVKAPKQTKIASKILSYNAYIVCKAITI